MKKQELKLSLLEINRGQLDGLPKNPRLIKDDRYQTLLRSITEDPEMLEIREIVVYPIDGGKFIVVAGNMRVAACRELGWKSVPCKILDLDMDLQKIKAISAKDNINYGEWEWDLLTAEWDLDSLQDWGVEAFSWESEDFDQEYNPPEKLERKTKKIVLEYSTELCQRVAKELEKHGAKPSLAVLSLLKIE